MPKVSVIVPVYKVEQYLHRCVDSILNQSLTDFELILVDDGSPDNCGSICDAYAQQDRRVHVIHQQNGGLSAARNTGIDWTMANSNSEWLTFIDSDDWVHKDFLQILYSSAQKNNAHISACGLLWTDRFDMDKKIVCPDSLALTAEMAFVKHQEKCTPACAKLIRKDLFQDIRFPMGKLHEDAYITHYLLFRGETVAITTEKLYYYYNNPTSITRAKWSDKKLDSIEAHERRLAYFRENNYIQAFRHEQRIYIEELTFKIHHLLDTRESGNAHEETLRLLQEKLRSAIAHARKEQVLDWNRELIWSYIFAMRTDIVWKTVKSAQKQYHKLKM